MKIENPGKIRNFAIAGHNASGKTTLCDQMLFKAGAVSRLGSVDNKTSVSDFTPDEQEKHSSIYSAYLNCSWQENHFFFTDTPGYGEFVGEVISAFRSCGFSMIVLDGEGGIEIGTTRAWKYAKEFKIPKMVVVNRLDRDMADFFAVLKQLQDAYGLTTCVPMTLPVGSGENFSRVVSVLTTPESEIPDDLKDLVAKYKEQLLDTVAESDEELMERYLGGEALSEEEISKGLHNAIFAGQLVPVFAASGLKDIGVTEIMNGLVFLMPNPLERIRPAADGTIVEPKETGDAAAFVFKSAIDPFIGQMAYFRVLTGQISSNKDIYNLNTGSKERIGQLVLLNGKEQIPVDQVCPGAICGIAKLKATKTGDTLGDSLTNNHAMSRQTYPNPVISYAIRATKSGDEDKIVQGIQRLAECDPTLQLSRNDETHETILGGMGEQHIMNAIRNLKALAKVDVQLDPPKIPYRETINAKGEAAYRHKKQSGGHGQFAEVHLRLEPAEEFEFVNAIVGGYIPKNYIPAVEKGVHEAMANGPLAGCVVERIRVTVFDGKYHDVDSSEMAFKIATRKAFKDAMAKAKPVLMEPVMSVKITIPDAYTGDITGNLNHKRGRILGMGSEDGLCVLDTEIPAAEIHKYATELRSMTQGKGSHEVAFARYENVPAAVQQEIITKFAAEHADDDE